MYIQLGLKLLRKINEETNVAYLISPQRLHSIFALLIQSGCALCMSHLYVFDYKIKCLNVILSFFILTVPLYNIHKSDSFEGDRHARILTILPMSEDNITRKSFLVTEGHSRPCDISYGALFKLKQSRFICFKHRLFCLFFLTAAE